MKRISIAGALLALCAVVGPASAAADDGDALAQLGKLDITVEDPPHGFDPREFLQLHEAAESGNADAQFGVGMMFAMGVIVTDRGEAEATALIRKAADQGYARAQIAVGLQYVVDNRVDADYVEAARWFRLAAEQRNRDGQTYLGLMYGVGLGVEQDYGESARLLRLAAEQGDGVAQARLGDMYAYGEGVERDPDEADTWYRLTVQKYEDPIYVIAGVEYTSGRMGLWHLLRLGELYRDGVGVPRNLVSAYRWMHISNQGEGWSTETPEGMVPYQREIDRLADRMTDEELAEARRAADEFMETYL